jgi:voltage-gated sodium channel
MTELARRVTDSRAFQHFITAVILLAGALVGVETSAAAVAEYGELLHALDRVVLGIFVLEISVKLAAEGRRPWHYFKDPFNVFDFTIVAASLLPFGGQYVTVLRLLRLLRVLRLVHALPQLQILVSALLKSIPSMLYVGVFLALLFYVYGVAGVFLFGQNDPARFGALDTAMLTLFTVVTLEGWADLMYTQLHGCEASEAWCTAPEAQPVIAPVYFVSFVLFGTMIVLNLFIGVIMNSMQQAAAENERAEELRLRRSTAPESRVQEEIGELHRAAEQLLTRTQHLQRQYADLLQSRPEPRA